MKKRQKKKLLWLSGGILAIILCVLACKSTYVTDSGKINHSLRERYFNDKNDKQLPAAKSLGITPVADAAEFTKIKGKLTKVSSSRGCFVLPAALSNYRPYLTADASALLEKIGADFADSLKVRNLPYHSILVTSIFRTEEDVKNLMMHNSNAIKNSTHRYGTTFDISYRHFLKHNIFARKADDGLLQDVLANVLAALKIQGCCYIIQELHQTCYHITVRKRMAKMGGEG